MTTEVLLVDDEEPILNVLARSLIARGYVVRTAATGEDALLALTEAVPDVMLLDINLPDITGWEVLRRMSHSDRGRVPVVVLSASPLAPHRVDEFKPAGMLIKPFPIEALLRLVQDVSATASVAARHNGA
jgi:two-component system response regulator MprA